MKTVLIILLVVIVLGLIEKWIDKHLNTPRDGYTPETGAKQIKEIRFGCFPVYEDDIIGVIFNV